MSSSPWIKWTQNRYNHLLLLIFGLLISIALPETQTMTRSIMLMLFSVAMLSIIRRIRPGRWWLKYYAGLVLLNLSVLGLQLIGLLNIATWNHGPSAIALILLIVISVPIWLLQQEFFCTRKVTADTLKGGIALYVLMGVDWSLFYVILFDFDPSSFYGINPFQFQSDFLHFSFVTLTTLGYGNILPLGTTVRLSSDLEAIAGIMYPAILISRLVSLYNTDSQEPL
jgi:hypothetical protein